VIREGQLESPGKTLHGLVEKYFTVGKRKRAASVKLIAVRLARINCVSWSDSHWNNSASVVVACAASTTAVAGAIFSGFATLTVSQN